MSGPAGELVEETKGKRYGMRDKGGEKKAYDFSKSKGGDSDSD